MTSSTNPENPHLTDIFRTALNSTSTTPEPETPAPRIVVNGNGNVVAFGGRVVIRPERSKGERR